MSGEGGDSRGGEGQQGQGQQQRNVIKLSTKGKYNNILFTLHTISNSKILLGRDVRPSSAFLRPPDTTE